MEFKISRDYYKIKITIKIWYIHFVFWLNEYKTCNVLLWDKFGFIYHHKDGGLRIGFDYYAWNTNNMMKRATPEQIQKLRISMKKLQEELSVW